MNDLADTVKHLSPKHLSPKHLAHEVPDVLRHLPGTVQHQVAHFADQLGDQLSSISLPAISLPAIPGRKRSRSKLPFVIGAVVAAAAIAVVARRRSAGSTQDVPAGHVAAQDRNTAAA